MPGEGKHSKKFDRCVRDVKRSGSAASAYAVCTKAVKNPRKRRMPAALARYWRKKRAARRARIANLSRGRESRRRNPKGFVIVGAKGGKRGYYDGANAFMDSKSAAHIFQARRDAMAQARLIRSIGAARGWRLSVTSA